ncbi:MAG: diguanylate cyclase [Zoogloeaceae bacterium]|nr:diguanylate cyclase [Zoogloeaceae bacterium]
MPNLDIRTLSFLAMISSILLAVGLQVVNRVITRDASLRLWAMGATATGLGFVLLALRGLIPDLISIVVANTLLVMGATWHYFGNRAFQGLPRPSPWYWCLAAATAVLFIHFSYLSPNLAARIVIISLVLAALRFASAFVLVRPASGRDSLVRWAIALAYGMAAAFFVVRAAVSFFIDPGTQNFMSTAGLVQTFAFVFEISLAAILGIGLPLLVLGRTHHLLEASERRYRNLSEWSPAPMGVHDGHRLIYVNPAAIQLFGAQSAQDLLGKTIVELTHPDFRQINIERGKAALETGQPNPMIEEKLLRLDGTPIDVELNSIPVLYEGQPAVQFAMNDITERKRMEDQVRQLAFHDPLTGLPNRRLLKDRLHQAMAASVRHQHFGAVMFLDLDNFKPLNDVHGHETGDLLLIEAAGRLKQCVRAMDTVARFGGDEFVVVINELADTRETSTARASLIAEKICTSLSAPYLLVQKNSEDAASIEHHCTVSIGVALFFGQESSQDEIIGAADGAMYQAKESGRNQFCIVPGND